MKVTLKVIHESIFLKLAHSSCDQNKTASAHSNKGENAQDPYIHIHHVTERLEVKLVLSRSVLDSHSDAAFITYNDKGNIVTNTRPKHAALCLLI